jgi:uncharacterized protein (DUF433 family)
MMEAVISEHIEITPGVCGGKPRIAGHRIRVRDIVVWHERLGLDPEEIVRRHPTITLGDVYAALAYYDDNRERIRGDIRESEALVREMREAIPSRVELRLAAQQSAR